MYKNNINKDSKNLYENEKKGGRFVFVNMSDESYNSLLKLEIKTAGVLFKLICNMDWDGFVKTKKSGDSAFLLPRKALEGTILTGISKKPLREAINALSACGFLEELTVNDVKGKEGLRLKTSTKNKDKFLRVTNKVAFKGKLKDNGVKQGEQYRVYTDAFYDMLANLDDEPSLEACGILLKMGLLLNRRYNVVTRDTQNLNPLDIKPLGIMEFTETIGVSDKVFRKHMTNLVRTAKDAFIITGTLGYYGLEGRASNQRIISVDPIILCKGTEAKTGFEFVADLKEELKKGEQLFELPY